MRQLLAVVFRWSSKHLTNDLPDYAATESAALKKRDQAASKDSGLFCAERARPLLRQSTAGVQLIEAVCADSRAHGLIYQSAFDPLPSKHLAYLGRRLAASEPGGRFGVRHLFVGQDADGRKTIERFSDQCGIGLDPPEPHFELAPSFPTTSERVDGAIAEIRDGRLMAEVGHGVGIELDARARGTGFAQRTDRDREYASVGERDHESPWSARRFEHGLDRARPTRWVRRVYEKSRGATHDEPW